MEGPRNVSRASRVHDSKASPAGARAGGGWRRVRGLTPALGAVASPLAAGGVWPLVGLLSIAAAQPDAGGSLTFGGPVRTCRLHLPQNRRR